MTALDVPRISRARASALGSGGGPAGPLRRNRGRIAAGVVLMVVCGWLAAVVFLSVGSRKEVLAVARPVERFAELSADDVRVVRVAADAEVGVVDADRVEELVGRTAAMELVPGALLQEDYLLGENAPAVDDGQAIVGALLATADAPGRLPEGAAVQVIVRPQSGSSSESESLEGWVLEVSDEVPEGVDGRWVSLVVAEENAGSVSAAAADRRVSVVVTGGP